MSFGGPRVRAAFAALLLAACSRAGGNADHGGASPASAFVPPPAATVSTHLILGALNVLLKPYLGVLLDHFGGQGDEPLAVERVDIAPGRTAILVSRLDLQDGMVLVVDGSRALWSEVLPATGPGAPLVPSVLAPAADGGVAVFGYVAAKHALWLRRWDATGAVTGDRAVATFDACSALTALYSPGLDWIVACSSPAAGTFAQRVRASGDGAWGDRGATLGDPHPSGPPTLVLSSAGSFMLFERAGTGDAFHLLAFRYDLDAHPLWSTPVDIGTPRRSPPSERFAAKVLPSGEVRFDLPQGLRGGRAVFADIAADGGVRLITP